MVKLPFKNEGETKKDISYHFNYPHCVDRDN